MAAGTTHWKLVCFDPWKRESRGDSALPLVFPVLGAQQVAQLASRCGGHVTQGWGRREIRGPTVAVPRHGLFCSRASVCLRRV